MRPLVSARPSWLSTVFFTLLAALYIFVFGVLYVYALVPDPVYQEGAPDEYEAAREHRDTVALEGASGCALIAAILAAWGWRAPRAPRFHIAYLSGLALIVVAAFKMLLRGEHPFREALEHGEQVALMQTVEDPLLAWLAALTGLVLILGALIQDRRT